MELKKTLRIRNELGLHARSAAKIVKMAEGFDARLFLKKDGQEVDASSILSILTLACPKGTDVEIRTEGPQSEPLMQEVCRLFESKFGEGE
jgi:phosphocarrier protein